MPKSPASPTYSIPYDLLYRGDASDENFAVSDSVKQFYERFEALAPKAQTALKPFDNAIALNGQDGTFYLDGSGDLVLGNVSFCGYILAIDATVIIKSVKEIDDSGAEIKVDRPIPYNVVWLALTETITTEVTTFNVGDVVPIMIRDTLQGKRGGLHQLRTQLKLLAKDFSNPFQRISALWEISAKKFKQDDKNWYQIVCHKSLCIGLSDNERTVLKLCLEMFADNCMLHNADINELPEQTACLQKLSLFAASHGVYVPIDFGCIATLQAANKFNKYSDLTLSPIVLSALSASETQQLKPADITPEQAKADLGY